MARNNYIDGTAVIRLDEQEQVREERIRALPRKPKYEVVEQEAVDPGRYNVGNVLVILLSIAVIGTFVAGYIKLNSDVVRYRKECVSLEKQYEKLKLSNDLYEDRIANSVDLVEIERIAACELGMKLAGKGQIVVYSGEIEDYVKQFEDLPR